MRRIIILLFSILLASTLHAQQPDWSKIEIKAVKVSGNVYMLYGVGGFAGGKIGVSVGEDGIVLVDDQFEPLVPKIQAALAGITAKPCAFRAQHPLARRSCARQQGLRQDGHHPGAGERAQAHGSRHALR